MSRSSTTQNPLIYRVFEGFLDRIEQSTPPVADGSLRVATVCRGPYELGSSEVAGGAT